jgi:hypothetical protein
LAGQNPATRSELADHSGVESIRPMPGDAPNGLEPGLNSPRNYLTLISSTLIITSDRPANGNYRHGSYQNSTGKTIAR